MKGVAVFRLDGTTVGRVGRRYGFLYPILPGSLCQKPAYLPVQALNLQTQASKPL